jgi:hypothetical protein
MGREIKYQNVECKNTGEKAKGKKCKSRSYRTGGGARNIEEVFGELFLAAEEASIILYILG